MAKKKADPEAVYDEFLRTTPTFTALGKQFGISSGTARKYVRDEIESRAPMGEVALVDPMRLFRGSMPSPYNPSILVSRRGLRIFDDMRLDDQVKASIAFKKLAVLSAGWVVESPADEKLDWEPRVFIEEQFKQLPGSFDATLMEIMTSLDYGYSVTEIVFEQDEGQVGLRALKTKKPHSFDFDTDEFGNIKPDGLLQIGGPDGPQRLPVKKFIIHTHQREFSNWYGKSDLEAAYRPWWTKDNAYKWLAMLLERFGIPPVFALYNPNKYGGGQIDKLFTAVKTIQAATGGVIPRQAPEDLEMWTPELAGQANRVFVPAMDMFNRDISRAILVPSLIGATPDDKTGSFARAKTSFDVFILLVQFLQKDIAEQAINDQLVRPLVDINFGGGEYPIFKFLPITDDVRLDLLEAWTKLIAGGVAMPQGEDENHIRSLLKFPERDVEEGDFDPEPVPEPKPDPEDPEDDSDKEEGEIEFAEPIDRAPNEFEKKVDFDAVERDLERIEADARASISDAVEGVRDTFIAFFQRKFDGNSSFINELKEFRKMPKVRQAIGSFLRDAFDSGRAAVRGEMKDAIEFAEDPNVVPKDALRRLRTREFWVTGIIEDDLLAESRNILLRAIETGEPARATELKLKEAFQPFIGDPSIVNDKGVVSSARLDTIIRTNTTDAYNRGRIVQARQAGPLLQAFEYSAILDSRTTAVCRHLDGKVFRSDDPDVDRLTPPRHFNCRSLLVPVTIGEPVDKFASKAEVGEGLELSGKGFK